jgi:hypothetical protein
VNITELRALYDQDQRQDVEYPFVRREVTPPGAEPPAAACNSLADDTQATSSRPILEKFGFQRISTAYACTWHVRKAEA